MAEDPEVVRAGRREWAVSFGVGAVLAGCLVAAVVFMALTFAILSAAPAGALPDGAGGGSVLRLALLIGGLAALALLVVGPTVAYAVGWLLRGVRNQSLHVLAFAGAGVVVGGVVGVIAGGPEAANILAAMVGASAAAGRAAVSSFAHI